MGHEPSFAISPSSINHLTCQCCQINRTHGSRTRPSGQNPSCHPHCLSSDPYWNGRSHRSVKLSFEEVSDFSELFEIINGIDENVKFVFDDEGKELLGEKMDEFVAEVDEAIKDGKVPPTSKTPELIQTIACALHVFNDTMEELLAGVPSSQPDTTISKTTLENAAPFLTHLETQKEILCHVRNR